MMKIKDENFYQVTGWMLNKLNLRGNSLNIFAIIYGFSQDGATEFKGSLNYLCDFVGATKPTIIKSINELIEKGLIIKSTSVVNNIQSNAYKVNLPLIKTIIEGSKEILPVVKNFEGGSKDFLLGGGKEILLGGSKEILPNNNSNNNNNYTNIDNNKEKFDYEQEFSNVEVIKTIKEFIGMRKLIKKPMTDGALKRMCNKLKSFSDDPLIQIKILEQSINNNWLDLYELKGTTQTNKPKETGINNNYI